MATVSNIVAVGSGNAFTVTSADPNLTVTNTGVIVTGGAGTSAGVVLDDSPFTATIEVAGSVLSNQNGIWLQDSGGTITIFGNGLVRGDNVFGIIAFSTSTIATTVNNAGTIIGGTAGIQLSGVTDDTVRNTGTITGDTDAILMQGGNDRVENIGGGIINGHILLGAGNDVFEGRGGTVNGEIQGGAGNDSYFVDGTGFSLVELDGGGFDTVISEVTFELAEFFENLSLIGTADIDGRGNAAGNNLRGNDGSNELRGLAGDDTFTSSLGDDTFIGGSGTDSVSYVNEVTVRLDKGYAQTADYRDTLEGIEDISGSGDNDTLVGDNGSNSINGSFGNDNIRGKGGNDSLNGSFGNDQLKGQGGNDTLNGSFGNDILKGNAGADVLNGSFEDDTLIGGAGNDSLDGGADVDTLNGSTGNDTLTGGGDSDTFIFSGMFGIDTITDFDEFDNAEKIDLSRVASIVGFNDLKNNHMSQSGGNVVIDDGAGNIVTVQFALVANMNQGDFIF